MRLWFATGNAHKKTELAAILASHGCVCDLCIPKDAGLEFDPEETENSFHGNALLKAKALYELLQEKRPALFADGDPVIADDSGICVDALGGRPGIYSARYPVKPGMEIPKTKLESAQRNSILLEEIGDNPMRNASFVCAMVLMFSPMRFFVFQETFEGEIVKKADLAKGSGGFGYDPIFFVPALGRTVAELSEQEKNRISHRGKAGRHIAQILELLRNFSF